MGKKKREHVVFDKLAAPRTRVSAHPPLSKAAQRKSKLKGN